MKISILCRSCRKSFAAAPVKLPNPITGEPMSFLPGVCPECEKVTPRPIPHPRRVLRGA